MPKKIVKNKKSSSAKPKIKVSKITKTKSISAIPILTSSASLGPEVLRTSPRDVFLHLLMLVMLYIGVISLISLAFTYVDYSFPDPLAYNYGSGLLSDVRWQSSMLIISFPLLLLLSHFVLNDFRKNPKKHELRFYKWLTYLTLFISAITIVIDLIQLVNRFYGGELTTAFVLKVFSVLVVAGAVFGYYIWDVQTESYKSQTPKVVAWITSAVVIFMLGLGFILAGSPTHQRQIRMDEQRVSDLSMIQNEVINYWQNKRVLPGSLLDLENNLTGFKIPQDPESAQPYEYTMLAPLRFQLCATFNQKSASVAGAMIYNYSYPYQSGNWQHENGRTCFERSIDPELYPEKQR